jgi:glycosyltransferase involved in cell wall biosynthesis
LSRPTVLFVSHDASLTGAPSCLGEVLASLAGRPPAFRPVVFVRGGGALLPAWRATGLRIAVCARHGGAGLPGKLLHRLRALGAYLRLLLETRPRLVYSNTILNNAEVVVARLLGARTLVHVHEGKAMMRRRRLALRVSSRFTSRYVCVSAYAARALLEIAGAHATVIANGVAPAAPAAAGAARRELVLGIVGGIQPNKGQHVAIEALAKLAAEGRAVRLLVFGEPEDAAYRRGLDRLVERLGVGERVEFRGLVQDRGAIYGGIDVLVVASLDEAFGRVILEAFAHGKPVVATAVGGIVEIVRDGDNGLLVPPGDPERLAAAVRRVGDDAELARRISAEGLAQAKHRYRLEDSVARLRSEIESLLAAGRP